MSANRTKSGTSYWSYGNKYAPLIIMIHGFRGTHHGLELIANNLPNFRVIIPDLPGFGETKPLEVEHTLDNYVEWLSDFFGELNLKTPPVLIGHSFGSIIASNFASKHPGKISKLILENPIGTPALEGPRAVLTQLAILYYWFGFKLPEPLGSKLLSSKLIVFAMSEILAKTSDIKMRKYIDNEHLKHFSTFANRKVVSEAFRTSIENNVRTVAPNVPMPTLLIVGEKDDITPLKKQLELYKMFPNAKIEILKNTGHLTHYETPEQVASAIISFLQ